MKAWRSARAERPDRGSTARAGQVVVDHDRAGRQDLELVAGGWLGDVMLPGRLAGGRVDADDVEAGVAGGLRDSCCPRRGKLLEATGLRRGEGPPLRAPPG